MLKVVFRGICFGMLILCFVSCFQKRNQKMEVNHINNELKDVDVAVSQDKNLRKKEYRTLAIGYPDLVLKDILSGEESNLKITIDDVRTSSILMDDLIFKIPFGVKLDAVRFFSNSDITVDDNGFLFYVGLPYEFSNGMNDNRWLVLYGGGFFIDTIYSRPDKKWFRSLSEIVLYQYNNSFENLEKSSPVYYFIDDGIQNLSAWSELIENVNEKEIVYEIQNLRNPLIYGGLDVMYLELNQTTLPWSEGVDGPGFGGTIDIQFDRKEKEIIVLNGYVDLTRQDLYKKNNRLKTIDIVSVDPAFVTTYTFKDVVMFHEVPLPDYTDSIQIIIRDVYPGSHYDDTCITKIFLPQKELRPRSEYEQVVKNVLQKIGYFD